MSAKDTLILKNRTESFRGIFKTISMKTSTFYTLLEWYDPVFWVFLMTNKSAMKEHKQNLC